MGTLLSTFPSLLYPQWEFGELHDYFQRGLHKAIREKNVVEVPRKSGRRGLENVAQAVRRASYQIELEDLSTRQEETIPAAEERGSKKGSRHPSNTFQPSRSRLPTPLNRSRRTSNSALANNNDHLTEPQNVPEVEVSRLTTATKRSDLANSNNANANQKPFRPEAWPTLEMIKEHLSNRQSQPTTILFARFAPRSSKNFIEIKYSTNKDTGETIYSMSDKVDLLIPSKEGYQVGETDQEQIDYFFLIFKTCINLLQGQVWWNGYSLIFDQNSTKNRLKVSAFEMEPSQLLFELTNMTDLEVRRSGHKIELRSKVENSSGTGTAASGATTSTTEEYRTFAFRGMTVKDIKVSKLRGTLITVHVPEFNPAMLPMSITS